jgi:hypothetical protein
LIVYEHYWIAIIYAVGVIANAEVNYILKNTIQEKRPEKEEFKNNPKIIYGMPSGHAQACFYSATFIWTMIENIYLDVIYAIFCIFTLIVSLYDSTHTLEQMAIGSFVGCFIAGLIINLLDTLSSSD